VDTTPPVESATQGTPPVGITGESTSPTATTP
jgi:hypothetical protein